MNYPASSPYGIGGGPLSAPDAQGSTYSVVGVESSAWAYPGTIQEGSGSSTRVGFMVERRGGLATPGGVAWMIEAFYATDGADFVGGTIPTGTLVFAPGEERKTVHVEIAGDHDFELLAEEFRLVLGWQTADGQLGFAVSHSVLVRDDDPKPVVHIAPLDADKPEGDEGATPFTFLFTRSGNLLTSVDVPWETLFAEDQVAPGQALSGTMNFAVGETEKVLTILVAGDRIVEPDRRLNVRLVDRDAVYERGGVPVAVGVIRADDLDIADIAVVDSDTGNARPVSPAFYYGPVWWIEKELILITPENLNVALSGPNWFVRTGSGNDAIVAHSGTNVLDGGTGSNFLIGGRDEDAFFIDARGLNEPVWSTVIARKPEDGWDEGVAIWVDDLSEVTMLWEEGQGAPGYEGLTLHVGSPGRPWASMTLPGWDLSNLGLGYHAQVGVWTGRTEGRYATDYIYVSIHKSHVTGV